MTHEISKDTKGIFCLTVLPAMIETKRGANNTPATIVNCHVPETNQPGPKAAANVNGA